MEQKNKDQKMLTLKNIKYQCVPAPNHPSTWDDAGNPQSHEKGPTLVTPFLLEKRDKFNPYETPENC